MARAHGAPPVAHLGFLLLLLMTIVLLLPVIRGQEQNENWRTTPPLPPNNNNGDWSLSLSVEWPEWHHTTSTSGDVTSWAVIGRHTALLGLGDDCNLDLFRQKIWMDLAKRIETGHTMMYCSKIGLTSFVKSSHNLQVTVFYSRLKICTETLNIRNTCWLVKTVDGFTDFWISYNNFSEDLTHKLSAIP